MNNLDTIVEKAEMLRDYLLRYTDRNVEIDNRFCVHISQLKKISTNDEYKQEKKLFQEMLFFMEEMQKKYNQGLKELEDLVEILDLVILVGKDASRYDNNYCEGIRILDVQEKERDRIARELHDSTVQDLTGIIYKVELCSKFLDKDITKVKLEQQLIICSLKKVIEEMRSIIRDLKPLELGENSLEESIRTYINSLAITFTAIGFEYKTIGTIRSMMNVYELTLLRIVKEACQNAVKHSGATCIQVELNFNHNKVILSIRDNGEGFYVNGITQSGEVGEHFGLAIMKERAELMGAKFSVSSQKGKGTVVSVVIRDIHSDEGDG